MKFLLLIQYDENNVEHYIAVSVYNISYGKSREVFFCDSGDPVEDYNMAYKYCYSHPDCIDIKDHDVNKIFIDRSNGKYAFDDKGFMREVVAL